MAMEGSKGQATAPKEARGHSPVGQHGQVTWGSLGVGWESTTKPLTLLWPPPSPWEDAPPGLIALPSLTGEEAAQQVN